jgi:hypothetical protein
VDTHSGGSSADYRHNPNPIGKLDSTGRVAMLRGVCAACALSIVSRDKLRVFLL